MIIFLYSDKNYEYQAIACIKSLQRCIADSDKIVYFTIDFDSEYEQKNLQKIKGKFLNSYPSFNFHKTEISLKMLELFPDEQDFIYTDSDVIFSDRFDPNNVKCNTTYPIASFGPHALPFIFETDKETGKRIEYNHYALMNKMNVQRESQRYVWSCFYSYNRKCKDFFEELLSIYNNQELMSNRKMFFPFSDETPFNVCLWKREANKNLGFAFVNTHLLSTVKRVEEENVSKSLGGEIKDLYGYAWDYIHDSKKVLFYHGCKEKENIDEIMGYLDGLAVENAKKQPPMKVFKNDQSNKAKKIAIVTLYDKNYFEFAKYSVPNKLQYANIHKYDLICFEGVLDPNRTAHWSKIKAIQYALNDYDWVWWIDIDSIVMNFDIKLESIIDENYDMIFTSNEHSFLSNGSSFFKSSELVKNFLSESYELKLDYLKDINPNVFDHEQQPMRRLLKNEKKYLDKTKFVDERTCNSFCKTNNPDVLKYYPRWNEGKNIYQDGDFVIQFCGRTIAERLNVMFDYILPKNVSVILSADNDDVIKKQTESLNGSRYKLDIFTPKKYQRKFASYSQLVNYSVNETNNEFMVYVNPKTVIDASELDRIIKLLFSGYCFVATVGLGLFGASKQIFREVGMLDERFLGGEYEDNDFAMRLKMYGKAVYAYFDYSKYSYSQANSKYDPIRGITKSKYQDKWNMVGENKFMIAAQELEFDKISHRHIGENLIKYSWYQYEYSDISPDYAVFNSARNSEIQIVNKKKVKKIRTVATRIVLSESGEFFISCNSESLKFNPINVKIVFTDFQTHHSIAEYVLHANTWWGIPLDKNIKHELRLFHNGNTIFRTFLIDPMDITLNFKLDINDYDDQ